MDMEAWERLTADSRLQDALIMLEAAEGSGDEDDEEEESGACAEVPCPFCDEEFDGFGLCCHIQEEHQEENRAGVCPICYDGVGMDLVGHITSQHPSLFKGKWKSRRASHASHSSTRATLKKDARQSLYHYGGSLRAASHNTEPDPLLSSFVGNFTGIDLPKDVQQELSDGTDKKCDSLEQKPVESDDEPLLPEVKEERTRRSQFVQGLVLSLMFDDIL
uniref:Drought induced 19 protein type zinc-binding domain-containing protein n=1 Tax=Leersia perrieri TaxID=77586 RepID=A0A0D9Y082_9ORYZ